MSSEDHKQALPPGFALGSYRVKRVLGVGGFGVTYLCEHSGLGIQVAVKEYLWNEIAVRDGSEVHPKSAGDRKDFDWGLRRFLDEARTLARFEHPNVVRVRDCFNAHNTAYIVMDYEDGKPLDVLLKRLGNLSEAQLKRVLLPVADGLRQVHAAGFLHRDVKPSNIFVRRADESPVLLDFGAARQALGRKSKSMTAIASAGYSPPEQYESDGEYGPWTDIYALSALCHRAITGKVPVEAPHRMMRLVRSQDDPLPKLAETVRDGYSPAFLEAVDRGLRVIEAERPQSLDEWLAHLQNASAKDSPRRRTRKEPVAEVEPQRVHLGTKPGTRFRDAPHCPEMVVVPAGSFMMGAPESEGGSHDCERPVHRVTISRPFAVGVYPVTFDEWDACVAAGGCGGHRPDDEGWGRGDRPVIHVSWEDARRYVEWLSRSSGHGYRLLTESEWEYAARAGTTTPFHTGVTITPQEANFGFFDHQQTVPVGSFSPNGFGLHDIHGNVREWVQDRWHTSYAGAPTDGSARETGYHRSVLRVLPRSRSQPGKLERVTEVSDDRVLRGGSWSDDPWFLRSTQRIGIFPGYRNHHIGFRVARTLAP